MITGNMMSGKTEELIARLRTLQRVEDIRCEAAARQGTTYRRRNIGVYKHALDRRFSADEITSHSGLRQHAVAVQTAQELWQRAIADDAGIVACDEVQFFMERGVDTYEIVQVLLELVHRHCHVVVSGLDKDFRGLPFGPIGDILALADERISLSATCMRCGGPAVLPQRLINGQPAQWDDPVVYPGATEAYEPRCRRCHEIAMPGPAVREAAAAHRPR